MTVYTYIYSSNCSALLCPKTDSPKASSADRMSVVIGQLNNSNNKLAVNPTSPTLPTPTYLLRCRPPSRDHGRDVTSDSDAVLLFRDATPPIPLLTRDQVGTRCFGQLTHTHTCERTNGEEMWNWTGGKQNIKKRCYSRV